MLHMGNICTLGVLLPFPNEQDLGLPLHIERPDICTINPFEGFEEKNFMFVLMLLCLFSPGKWLAIVFRFRFRFRLGFVVIAVKPLPVDFSQMSITTGVPGFVRSFVIFVNLFTESIYTELQSLFLFA